LKVTAKAPGKLVLLGEYAVLGGAPALVAAINRYARVTLQNIEQQQFSVDISTPVVSKFPLPIDKQGKLKLPQEMDGELLRELKCFVNTYLLVNSTPVENKGYLGPNEISLNISDFFWRSSKIKLGLGSSAALTVALLGALTHSSDVSPPKRWQLFQKAFQTHRTIQGNLGSGIDVAASVYGGILRYTISKEGFTSLPQVDKLSIPIDLHMQCIWTGKSASTRELIRRVRRFKHESPANHSILMSKLVKLSTAGCTCFAKAKTGELMNIVKQYYDILLKLSKESDAPIISPEHLQLAEIVYQAGGFYKPSGAGGGDCGIALSNSSQVINKIRERVTRSGFANIDLKFGVPGILIKVNED
jgi:phosphomevalonate kinase